MPIRDGLLAASQKRMDRSSVITICDAPTGHARGVGEEKGGGEKGKKEKEKPRGRPVIGNCETAPLSSHAAGVRASGMVSLNVSLVADGHECRTRVLVHGTLDNESLRRRGNDVAANRRRDKAA